MSQQFSDEMDHTQGEVTFFPEVDIGNSADLVQEIYDYMGYGGFSPFNVRLGQEKVKDEERGIERFNVYYQDGEEVQPADYMGRLNNLWDVYRINIPYDGGTVIEHDVFVCAHDENPMMQKMRRVIGKEPEEVSKATIATRSVLPLQIEGDFEEGHLQRDLQFVTVHPAGSYKFEAHAATRLEKMLIPQSGQDISVFEKGFDLEEKDLVKESKDHTRKDCPTVFLLANDHTTFSDYVKNILFDGLDVIDFLRRKDCRKIIAAPIVGGQEVMGQVEGTIDPQKKVVIADNIDQAVGLVLDEFSRIRQGE